MVGKQPPQKKHKSMKDVQPTIMSCFAPKDSNKAPKETRPPQIFCDLDGVLVDLDRGLSTLKKERPGANVWSLINSTPHFFRDLEWTSDGETLWDAIRPLRPHILTGVTNGSVSQDKFEWCKDKLAVEVQWRDMAGSPRKQHTRVPHEKYPTRNEKNDVLHNAVCTVITCWTINKHIECRPGDILIDDRPEKLQESWERKKGTFVHHVSSEQTLRKLRELGLLRSDTIATTLLDSSPKSALESDAEPETTSAVEEIGAT